MADRNVCLTVIRREKLAFCRFDRICRSKSPAKATSDADFFLRIADDRSTINSCLCVDVAAVMVPFGWPPQFLPLAVPANPSGNASANRRSFLNAAIGLAIERLCRGVSGSS